MRQLLDVSESALEQIRFLLAKRGKPSAGIRIGTKAGGCSGMKYVIEYADNISEFDAVIQKDDVTILVDRKAELYLIGSLMDYVEEKFNAGFVFVNPNETSKCGCGKSFSV